jgi:hypothetical protein
MTEKTMRATTFGLLGPVICVAFLLGLLGAGLAWGCTTYDAGTGCPGGSVQASFTEIYEGEQVTFTASIGSGHDWDTVNGVNTDQGAGTIVCQWDFSYVSPTFNVEGTGNPVSHVFNTAGTFVVQLRTDDVGTVYNDAPALGSSVTINVYERPHWDPDTANHPITGSITAPTSQSKFAVNKEVQCSAQATDLDRRHAPRENPEYTYPADSFNNADAFTWSVGAGSFLNGDNTGSSVTWVTPSSAASNVAIICDIKDDAPVVPPPAGETGSRNDNDIQLSNTGITIFDVQITHCPTYFVPGHQNIIKYRIYPDDYNAAYGKLEIFARDENGNPTGSAIYTSYDLNLGGGAERLVIYSGTQISYSPGQYIVRITVGESVGNAASDQSPFDVKAWDLLGFLWDYLSDEDKSATDQASEDKPDEYVAGWDPFVDDNTVDFPYCAGVNSSTVNSSKVGVTVWYWDETEQNAVNLYIDDGTPTQEISDGDWGNVWGQDIEDKPWYDERGSSLTNLNGTFYSMSEDDHYFYIKIVVAIDGVLDNVNNEFDANPDTEQREDTIIYKLKIDGDGNITIIEETYQ